MESELIKKIVSLFNESVKSYNDIVELRGSNKTTLIQEFNSNIQFYSSIECAFRAVIEESIDVYCPHELHLMIEILVDQLQPSSLEQGIDLFYILRYKDTRNATVHNIDLCELNAYPRLFENGAKFIRTYIDSNAEFISWKIETNQFDFSDFNQLFKTSMYDNIRILVLPPLHDYSSEEISALKKYHWNIILDFDPYSEVSGTFSKLKLDSTKLVQLSKIEDYGFNDFSTDDTIWVMCDGDKIMNINSFHPDNGKKISGPFIPAMVEGPHNWTQCYNLSESNMPAKRLLDKFFEKYYLRIQYNTELVFLMDYTKRINEVICNSISDNLSKRTYRMNVYFINESLTKRLYEDAQDYSNWNIYDSSIRSFLKKVQQNAIGTKESEENVMLLPCLAPCTGKLMQKSYYHITQQFYVLHSEFPRLKDDETADFMKLNDNLVAFSRGERVSWNLLKKRLVAQFDIYESVARKVEAAVSSGKRFYNLYHVAGFGGSTIAKQVAYKLHDNYPVLFMKKYVKDDLYKRITQIYNITHQRVVVFVEENLFDNVIGDRNECLRIADSTSAQVIFIFISRRPQSYSRLSEKDGVFICKYGRADVQQLIEFNQTVMGIEGAERKLLSESAETFIEKLGEDNICPFLINLSIYKDEFIKIDSYVQPFVEEIEQRPDLKKVFIYTSIFSAFINKGIPVQFVCKQLSLNEDNFLANLMDKYDPLLYIRHNDEFFITEIAIRAPYMAEWLLKKLLGCGEEGIAYREELNRYLISLIEDINGFYSENQYARKCLQQLFIDKNTIDNNYDELSEVVIEKDLAIINKYFAPVISKLWDKDNINLAGYIFESLIKYYPEEPYFYAHSARYYAYTGRDFERAKKYYNLAIEKINNNTKQEYSKADIYHVKGMCLREELFRTIENVSKTDVSCKMDFTELKKLLKEAEDTFETTRILSLGSTSKNMEYSCTAWLTLIIRLFSKNSSLNFLSKEEIEIHIERALDIISNLEEIYIMNEKESNYDYDEQLDDLSRKKETINAMQKEYGTAIGQWNNYYDVQKVKGNYTNCIYACKHKYYLIEKETQNFTSINKEDRARIENLAGEYYDALIRIKSEELTIGDLQTYLMIAKIAGEKTIKVMPLLSNFYQQDKKNADSRILLYRYIIKFLNAYNGEILALQECISYLTECKKYSEKIPGNANAMEYFHDGKDMGQIVSKKWIIRTHPEFKAKLYKSPDISYIYGVLKQTGMETTIIPYDAKGKLMSGIEVHANIRFNPEIETSDSGKKVKFKFGFSYDGLKAENMSISYVDEENAAGLSDSQTLQVGEYTEFSFNHNLRYSNNKIYGLVGKVGANEQCMIHISKITSAIVSQEDIEKLEEYCGKNVIQVQLISQNERGWQASLKSQKIDFNNLDLLKKVK